MVVGLLSLGRPVVLLGLGVSVSYLGGLLSLLKLAKLSLLLASDLLGVGMMVRRRLVMSLDRQVRGELYPG